jgi:hypothetical protein
MQITRRTAPALILPLFLSAMTATGCDIALADRKHQETSEWRKTFELQSGGQVEVSNTNGLITVEPSTGKAVEVVAVKTGRGRSPEDAKRALGDIEIAENADAAGVRIETRIKRSHGWFGSDANVKYTVRVPDGLTSRFLTTNGGVELRGVSGTVTAESTNGGIVAREMSGAFTGITTNGGVDVDMARLGDGGARLECTNGGVSLRLPADARASISASVTNGGIDTGGLPLEKIESTRRKLEAKLNGGGAPVRMSCTNGGLEIKSR